MDGEQRIGSFPPNYVQMLASGATKPPASVEAKDATPSVADGIEDRELATLSFGELLKAATDLQRRVKEHELVNLNLLEEAEIARRERIVAVSLSLSLALSLPPSLSLSLSLYLSLSLPLSLSVPVDRVRARARARARARERES